jgi:5-methylcytosine-specific restriction protein A
MPFAAPRYCTKPGHPAFTGRRCPECERIHERVRGSAAARGYDGQWRRLRLAVLAEEPLCRLCAERGEAAEATDVDHIIPLAVRPDLRLVRSNVRPLCSPCHRAVTRAFNHRRGAVPPACREGGTAAVSQKATDFCGFRAVVPPVSPVPPTNGPARDRGGDRGCGFDPAGARDRAPSLARDVDGIGISRGNGSRA